MADQEFKIGDTVQLKSGGPIMTIILVGKTSRGTPYVRAKWFNGEEYSREDFHPDTLNKSQVK